MKKKRIYALSATLGLLAGLISTNGIFVFGNSAVTNEEVQITQTANTFNERFSDVKKDDWFYEYVEYLAENNIVTGVTETEYAPDETFSIVQSAAIISRYLNLEEEAKERKTAMELLGVNGADKWYSGYIQLMYDAGIIDVTEYGCSVNGNSISIDEPEKLERPIKRYEFATFVVRSFELDGTNVKSGENNDSNGSEFIKDGKYDESVLSYYVLLINDYKDIPAEYNYYILKAYYNGIFNGDNFGNFNPDKNLTRAEAAKVTAVIIDKSLRTYPDISRYNTDVAYVLTDDSYITKYNNKYLKTNVSDMILQNEASGVTTFYENNVPYVSYEGKKLSPVGYVFEIRHYSRTSYGYDIEVSGNNMYSDFTQGYKNTFSAGDRLLILLKDTTTGETVDVYKITLDGVGIRIDDDCTYYRV